MALPFLQHERIRPVFELMKEAATTEPLQQLVSYVETTWVRNTTWPPSSWSAFMQPVRTNNHVEGWHRRLNRRAVGSSLPFYILVPLLYQKAKLVTIQMKLVGEGKLSKIHRKKYRTIQGRLFQAWSDYNDGHLSTSRLLRHCAGIYSPDV